MSATVAILGPGAVGGALAVHLSLAGTRVICVARRETVEAIMERGVTLELGDDEVTVHPDVVERLGERVDLLLVTVKSPALERALSRVDPEAVADGLVVALLNGLEHVGVIRARLEAPTAAGSVSRFEAYRSAPARIVQTTETMVVTVASDDVSDDRLERSLAPFIAAGVDIRLGESEKAVLWEKAARLGPLAAVTALTQRSIGDLRRDPDWSVTLEAAIRESCAVAVEEGVATTPPEQWDIVASLPPDLTTSAARDVAVGRPSELDAITGAIVRAGRRHGVATPTLDHLLAQLDAA
jgi:2-dehydropantoate 2-reductase